MNDKLWNHFFKRYRPHDAVAERPSAFTHKTNIIHPFWVMVSKEISDQVRSWRFIIMAALIALTCLGSLYAALAQFGKQSGSAEDAFFFLNLFTLSDGTCHPLRFYQLSWSFAGISLGLTPSIRNKTVARSVVFESTHLSRLCHQFQICSRSYRNQYLVRGIGVARTGFGIDCSWNSANRR